MRTIDSNAAAAHAAGAIAGHSAPLRAVLGRVKQVRPRERAASNDGRFETHALEAWARRALAANGFGGVELPAAARAAAQAGAGESLAQLVDVPQRASFAQIVRAFAELAADALRGAIAQWRAGRIARAARAALAQLDDRTLRDLGLHRSELGSVAAELARETDASRRRVLLSLHMHAI